MLELATYALMLAKTAIVVVSAVGGVDLTLVLIVFLLALFYVLWLEKDRHFYRDYSYTFLLAAFPDALLAVCIATWSASIQV